MTPRCVAACPLKNQDRFPEPKKPIPANWPKGQPEYWSDKRQVTDRLTPYNWTYLQKATVQYGGKEYRVPIPRHRPLHIQPLRQRLPQGRRQPPGVHLSAEVGWLATKGHNVAMSLLLLGIVAHLLAFAIPANRRLIKCRFHGQVDLAYAEQRHPLGTSSCAPG